MAPTGSAPLEETHKPVMSVTTVGEDHKGARKLGQSHKDRIDLSPLGRLPGSRESPRHMIDAMPVKGEAPSGSSPKSVDASSICGDLPLKTVWGGGGPCGMPQS